LLSLLIAMSARDAFGPNLRRIRIQRGVSLESIAGATKVSVDLWKALERNDFHRWPSGIYARAYLRSYAEAIGVDAETTIDDFCRWFPQGDRRAGRTVREQAAIIGHVRAEQPGIVQLKTAFGGTRIVDLLVGDPLPRIC